MPAGVKRVLLAGAVVLLALAAPAGAFAKGAGGCNASACKVYTEPPGSAGKKQQPPPSSSSTGSPTKPVPVPSKTSRLLANAGKDKAVFSNLISNPAYGATRGLDKSGSVAVVSPSMLGAALDLGPGPLALLGVLLALALGFGVHQHVRRRGRGDGPSA